RVSLKILQYDAVTDDSPRYTVQVAAFGDADRAQALAEDLRRRYPETQVSDDGAWHRVQVGVFGRRNEAEDLRTELLRLGLTALVVTLRGPEKTGTATEFLPRSRTQVAVPELRGRR